MNKQEDQHQHHWEEGREGLQTEQEISLKQLNEGGLHTASRAADPEQLFPGAAPLVNFKPVDEAVHVRNRMDAAGIFRSYCIPGLGKVS